MSVVIERVMPADASAVLAYLAQIGGETDNLSFGAEGLPFSVESETAYLAQMQDSNDDMMLVKSVFLKTTHKDKLSLASH